MKKLIILTIGGGLLFSFTQCSRNEPKATSTAKHATIKHGQPSAAKPDNQNFRVGAESSQNWYVNNPEYAPVIARSGKAHRAQHAVRHPEYVRRNFSIIESSEPFTTYEAGHNSNYPASTGNIESAGQANYPVKQHDGKYRYEFGPLKNGDHSYADNRNPNDDANTARTPSTFGGE